MQKRIKHIIAIGLMVLFLTPIAIQVADSLFHQHEHLVCNAKTEKHLHIYKKDCTISSFTFSSFVVNKVFYSLSFYPKIPSFLVNFYAKIHLHFSNYLFLLRAPPCNVMM